MSARDFSNPSHLPAFLDEVLSTASDETRALCGDNPECIFDATETGNMDIGLETLQTNQENNNDQMIACKFRSNFHFILCNSMHGENNTIMGHTLIDSGSYLSTSLTYTL